MKRTGFLVSTLALCSSCCGARLPADDISGKQFRPPLLQHGHSNIGQIYIAPAVLNYPHIWTQQEWCAEIRQKSLPEFAARNRALSVMERPAATRIDSMFGPSAFGDGSHVLIDRTHRRRIDGDGFGIY